VRVTSPNEYRKMNFACQTKLQTKLVALSLLVLATACTHQPYQAKPLDPAQVRAKLANKDVTNADFKAYLIKQGYDESKLPFAEWGVDELTLCALYFNPKLDVAKAQLALANVQIETANQRQSPTLGGRAAHSNLANDDKNPWAFGLEVEIPIETTNKRQIKVEEAQHLQEVARIDVADVAWQLRSQIAKDLLAYHENIAQQKQLDNELTIHNNLVKLLEKRVQLGAASNTELNAAKLLQQKAQFSLNSEQIKSAEIRAALAADVGLSTEKFAQLQLKPLDIDSALSSTPNTAQLQAKKLQASTLLNRLDIRRSLAKYAAAESKIKLEIAKQTPDISLSPGFAFEFGDSIWSLGFSTLLNLLNKNPTLIAEATQLREIEGAQFEALQANVIADVSQANAAYSASQQNVVQVRQQLAARQQVTQKLQRQLDAGQIDRLDLTQNQLNTALLEQQLLNSKFQQLNVLLALENSLQMPLNTDTVLNSDNMLNYKTIQIQRVSE
jgi:outer membrane protein, heavy metal efflux system